MKERTFSPFRKELAEIISRFSLPSDSLQIVESIQEYCIALGQPDLERSARRIAKCLISDAGSPVFLLWDHADASDGMMPLIMRNFPEEDVRLLGQPELFAKHQLLHEIAHFSRRDLHASMHHGQIERDCDQWAFDQLKSLTNR